MCRLIALMLLPALLLCCLCYRATNGGTHLKTPRPIEQKVRNASGLNDLLNLERRVKLEKSPESVIGSVAKVAFDSTCFVVLDGMRGLVLCFDRNGHFMRVIGSKGEGPQQYAMPHDIDLRGDTVMVLCLKRDAVLSYRTDGSFLREYSFRMEAHTVHPRHLATDKEGRYFYARSYMRDDATVASVSPDGPHQISVVDMARKTVISSFLKVTPVQDSMLLDSFRDIVVDASGNLWVLGIVDPNIYVFTREGRLLKTVDLSQSGGKYFGQPGSFSARPTEQEIMAALGSAYNTKQVELASNSLLLVLIGDPFRKCTSWTVCNLDGTIIRTGLMLKTDGISPKVAATTFFDKTGSSVALVDNQVSQRPPTCFVARDPSTFKPVIDLNVDNPTLVVLRFSLD